MNKLCLSYGNIRTEEFELKKDQVCEVKENEICVTVHAIKSAKEAVDAALRQVNMG